MTGARVRAGVVRVGEGGGKGAYRRTVAIPWCGALAVYPTQREQHPDHRTQGHECPYPRP